VRVWSLLLIVGCSYVPPRATDGTDADPDRGDASVVGDGTCTPGFVDLCGQPPPTDALDITGPDTIDTDTDPRCVTVMQIGGPSVCLVHATTVNIGVGGSLTATGSRPLAIAAATTMTVGGAIDVSSRPGGTRGPAADDSSCTFDAIPELDAGGSAGGAGGGLGFRGGSGGIGDTNTNGGGSDGVADPGRSGPPVNPTVLRGGCRGQVGADSPTTSGAVGGAGGSSGGALYLYAGERIEITGTIRATGLGGGGGEMRDTVTGTGGGGGGSGGLVVIESATIVVSGQISANGGGGGEGGVLVCGGSCVIHNGASGTRGAMGTTPAPGGDSTGLSSGAPVGGNGGAGSTPATAGGDCVAGGGGGGGGSGVIRLLGATSLSGIISPPPT